MYHANRTSKALISRDAWLSTCFNLCRSQTFNPEERFSQTKPTAHSSLSDSHFSNFTLPHTFTDHHNVEERIRKTFIVRSKYDGAVKLNN